ncbi:MAG: glucosaminidase domain-containing protein [Clostridiales Family XIII bacterium]|nr:glucosaminidase domain-containing protein [Clostridiales Family XIII bacterium]
MYKNKVSLKTCFFLILSIITLIIVLFANNFNSISRVEKEKKELEIKYEAKMNKLEKKINSLEKKLNKNKNLLSEKEKIIKRAVDKVVSKFNPNQKDVVKKVVSVVLRKAPKKKINPSLVVAQATVESGMGTSNVAKRDNNLFGIRNFGRDDTYSYYDSVEESVEHYLEVLHNGNYNDVLKEENAKTQIKKMAESPYVGKPDIEKYDVLLEKEKNLLSTITEKEQKEVEKKIEVLEEEKIEAIKIRDEKIKEYETSLLYVYELYNLSYLDKAAKTI